MNRIVSQKFLTELENKKDTEMKNTVSKNKLEGMHNRLEDRNSRWMVQMTKQWKLAKVNRAGGGNKLKREIPQQSEKKKKSRCEWKK